jgi:hypothetical protein
MAELNKVSEGQSHTLGAYYRPVEMTPPLATLEATQ